MSAGRLADDVAIVTGAASGIGREIATTFASEGATVVVADIDAEGGAETVDAIAQEGGEATFVETDVTDEDAVESLVETTTDAYDTIDILINNAGAAAKLDDGDNLENLDKETWDANVAVNLTSAYLCSRKALPVMLENGGGRMVHTCTMNALTGLGLTSYSAAKGGLLPFSRLIANQYGRRGIRSNIVCPGQIDTGGNPYTDGGEKEEAFLDQIPAGRFGRPEDIANAVLYLASPAAEYVNGTKIVVDGGFTAGPDQTLGETIYDI